MSARASIGVILIGTQPASGGRRNILLFCRDFAAAGHDVTLYVQARKPAAELRRELEEGYFPLDLTIERYSREPVGHDALVCTFWKTAYDLRVVDPRRVFYFVQDFEPMFYPVGSDYVKSLSTYRKGFHLVCRGRWIAERIRRELDVEVDAFDIPVDKVHYHPADLEAHTDVLFYARRGQPRRCYELGIEALARLRAEMPHLRIGLFGEPEDPELDLGHQTFGRILDHSRLEDLYRRSRVGVCFSTTNASSVAYEMLACGLPLVDLKVPGHELNFAADCAWFAEPTPEAVAGEIRTALSDDLGRTRRIRNGLDYVANMPSEEEFSRRFLRLVLARTTQPPQG